MQRENTIYQYFGFITNALVWRHCVMFWFYFYCWHKLMTVQCAIFNSISQLCCCGYGGEFDGRGLHALRTLCTTRMQLWAYANQRYSVYRSCTIYHAREQKIYIVKSSRKAPHNWIAWRRCLEAVHFHTRQMIRFQYQARIFMLNIRFCACICPCYLSIYNSCIDNHNEIEMLNAFERAYNIVSY